MAIAIIPARAGSQRIPGKNWKLFHGKPIIAYSIETVINSNLFDDVYVSTDSNIVADIAQMYTAPVLRRHPNFAKDNVGTQEVMRQCVIELELPPHELVCCIYATAPLMSAADLRRGRDYMYLGDRLIEGFTFAVSQSPLFDAGQFYWGTAQAFQNEHPLISSRSVMIPIAPKRVCDINTMEDWEQAEKMYADLQVKKP